MSPRPNRPDAAEGWPPGWTGPALLWPGQSGHVLPGQAAYARLGQTLAAAGPVPCRSQGRRDEWHEDVGAEGAARLCAGCPALTECRDYALAAREPHGVWGGLIPAERSRLVSLRRAGVAAAV